MINPNPFDMQLALCGVCNEKIPMDHVCIIRKEDEEEFTLYHATCEGRIPKEPCEDCGYHRLMCNECKEWEEDE